MSKALERSATIVATIKEIGVAGRLEQGQISVLLVCGEQDVILTMSVDTAGALGEGLNSAVERAASGLRDDT